MQNIPIIAVRLASKYVSDFTKIDKDRTSFSYLIFFSTISITLERRFSKNMGISTWRCVYRYIDVYMSRYIDICQTFKSNISMKLPLFEVFKCLKVSGNGRIHVTDKSNFWIRNIISAGMKKDYVKVRQHFVQENLIRKAKSIFFLISKCKGLINREVRYFGKKTCLITLLSAFSSRSRCF